MADGNGTRYASFGLAADGSPVLGFNDKTGTTRVMIGILDGQPEVSLRSSDGTVSWKARD